MCVVNKQLEHLEFVFDSVYVIRLLSLLLLGLCACVVCLVMWSSLVCVRLSRYPMWVRWLR